MPTRTYSPSQQGDDGRPQVALVRSGLAPAPELRSLLSSRESRVLDSIRRASRRAAWLRGRIGAKYLFLRRSHESVASRSDHLQPELVTVDSRALGSFSPWLFRRVEVLASGDSTSGRPQLHWCGSAVPGHVAVTHSGGTSCSCLSAATPVGIDLEQSATRCGAFYSGNFTRREQEWVRHRSAGGRLNRDWLFTLLWTLKESALKATPCRALSLWNFPQIDIDVAARADSLAPHQAGEELGQQFAIFPATVRSPGRHDDCQVTLTATRNSILSLITYKHRFSPK